MLLFLIVFFPEDSFEHVKETDIYAHTQTSKSEQTQTGKEKEMEWKIKT